MPAQLRLLLWKDYLVRRRKLITLAGIIWATAVMLSLYIVRANVDNQDFPTCQFGARALPSAGLLSFLQSFLCGVNNECSPLNQFNEIPSYENSKLTKLQRQFSPLLYNETVLDVAATFPDALKLLSKLADIVDEPTFLDISKNGLRVRDLFGNPTRVKRYLSSHLHVDDDVMQSLMWSELSFQGILKGKINKCSVSSMSQTLMVKDKRNLEILVEKLCSLSDKELQKIVMDLLVEVNFSKYIRMIGNMYSKLNGDERVTALGDMVAAVLRMTRLQSFLPPEVGALIGDDGDFSYFHLEMIHKLMDQFEPTFGETEAYKSIREIADTAVAGLQYLAKFFAKRPNATEPDTEDINIGTKTVLALSNVEAILQETEQDSSIDVFNVLSKITTFIFKWLPANLKHDAMFYSTLLTKLIEGANNLVSINMNLEERTYDISLRHPGAIKILKELPGKIIAKGFEGLADAERAQIITAKITTPGQVFCDVNRIQGFLQVSKDEADSLKKQLCTEEWKSYVTDLLRSFGIFDVKDNINAMAWLFIQETLGKDISDQLYTIDYDFRVLKNFTQTLGKMTSREPVKIDWVKLFNVSEDSELIKTVRDKGHLGKQMLITVHGALAKEVVKQNAILSYKISPGLVHTTILVTAINKQLSLVPEGLTERVRKVYPEVLKTVIGTMLNEDKTYKSLSTHSEDIMCNGVENASTYLYFPQNVDKENLLATLCDITKTIEAGFKKDSAIGKALEAIRTSKDGNVNWTALISGLKNMYVTLEKEYPYLFEYASYGMDEGTSIAVGKMMEVAKEYWFGNGRLGRSLHLSVKMGFRLLDLLERPIFNFTDGTWSKIKYAMGALAGPVAVFDDFLQAIAGISLNMTHGSTLPPATMAALNKIIPNLPQLIVDTTAIVVRGDTDLTPIISVLNAEPPWPCSTSLAEAVHLSPGSADAVMALESIMCMDDLMREEWEVYLADRNVTMINMKKWNSTSLEPHVFLKFSAAFDSLVEDAQLAKQIVLDMANGTRAGVTWPYAVKHLLEILNRSDRNAIFSKFFASVDAVLSAVSLPDTGTTDAPLNGLWSAYLSCGAGASCRPLGRLAGTRTLQFLSVMLENVAADLFTYFKENNEPNANLLQLMGFTKNTPLYEIYDKLPEFMGVLLNSYFDYGFMSQIRRASLLNFWDCEAVLFAMVPPPGSIIDTNTLKRVQPYVCPSFLYWLSLPRGDNTLLDVISKPQYFYYTLEAKNLTSSYENAYKTVINLTNLLTEINNKNKTLLTDEDIKLNSLEGKLEHLIDKMFNYKINQTDVSYRLFNEINTKQFASTIYLTRVVEIVNKLSNSLEDLQINEATDASEEELKKIKEDLTAIQKLFKRRRTEVLGLHFDVITDVVWTNTDEYNLTTALKSMCDDFKNNVTTKDILIENQSMKNQICSKKYDVILKWINLDLANDLSNARVSLLNLVATLRNGEDGDVTDIFKFLNERKQLVKVLRTSIKYAYDLNMSTYLQYLRSTIQHYDVILTFLSGGDWWKALRDLYRGPIAEQFLDSVENSFDVAEDVLTNLDKIHLVRLMHDINVNNTDLFCMDNVTLADYIPDRSGALSQLKRQLCHDNSPLLAELPPLLFASVVYDSSLQLPKEINYTALNLEISKTESMLHDLRDGPMAPQRPSWVTDPKIVHLREVALQVLSKESLTKMSFALLSNLVDAGTLFLNNSHCPQCSYLTSWLKQLNLQVFKKQEYDSLLCHLHDLTLEEVHHTLKNDFHWDMAIRELLSVRNYTKYELNKSLNEFLELVKLHLLEDIQANSTKLADCLARNVTRNGLGNATLFITVLSHTARLLRAEAPYLHEIEGITSLPYLVQLSTQVAPRLDVTAGLKQYLTGDMYSGQLKEMVGDDVTQAIKDSEVNLRLIGDNQASIDQVLKLQKYSWEDICKSQDCKAILRVINDSVNKTLVEKQLLALQSQEFWRFSFVSEILRHVEGLLGHVARLGGVASRGQLGGVAKGRLAPTIDFLLQVLMHDTLTDILYSIHGVVTELRPLLHGGPLERDVLALASGLQVLQQFKDYVMERDDLNVEVGRYFSSADSVEAGLSRLGLNNTNFWSVAAPRLHAGRILLKPLFQPQEDFHIANFVCQPEQMAMVFDPADLGVVTAEDVFGAIAEQFCTLPDERAKEVIPVLVGNLNFSAVLEKVANTLLPQLFSASNLTLDQGTAILDKFPQMAALLPTLQSSVGDLGETVAKDPLMQTLRNFSSVGGLLGSSSFLSQAGNMMCGKPFVTDTSRFVKAIAESEDFTTEVDQAQLDVLPTDFCRDLYRDIVHMNGGKIVWSFVKPLLMGRILYTPANDMVERIIRQANASFAHMGKLTELVHSFADSFPSVDQLSVHREGLSALRRIISSPAFADLRGTLVGDGDVPDVDVDGLFDEFGDLQGVGSILKKGSDLLRCINLNRFIAVPDEFQLSHEAVKLSRVDEFSAGLVFLNSENQHGAPLNIEYKIRMDIENTPTTARKKNYLWIPGPESSFLEHMRYFRGFVQLQDMVDNAIIQLSRSNSRQKRETEDEMKWAIYTQQIPYPCYRKDFFQTSLYESQALLVALFFSLLFTVSSAVRFIVSDKETGNTMLMSVMGVSLSSQSLSWFAASLVEMVATCCCMTLVLALSGVLPHTPALLLLALLVDFGLAVLAFCYMMSKLFKSASLAAVCTAILYLMTFMPFVIILSLEAVLSLALKLLVCLSMSSAICYAFLYIAQLEAMGTGAQWAHLWVSPDGGDMTIGLAALMVLLDAAIYLAIGFLLDKFFGPKTLQSNITHCYSAGEKAGVSIVNVTKVYGEGSSSPKLALENVSIELQKGQITTLLGHNGAGKTTLINILTGMLKPTKGHIVIRSEEQLGTCLGVCPQQDVLFEQLSASEHVALYAQLKSGRSYHEMKDEVDSILRVLSLGAVSREPVWRLSGGTRRRLCVALAFVAEPGLVTLDEPTAGVDPSARRDIWSMIVKLRTGRTILMTTHHLDEAELLSDQIVIMHKGQVHTTGSPIEIKRTLGNGYKLSVVFPQKTTLEEPWLEDFSMEERTKQLLTVVRQNIRNATLVDVNGSEVEIVLPFFGPDGVNNDFHQLCLALESRQEELGFKSYSLDCSSLEQVFFNICQEAVVPPNGIEYDPDTPSKSASTSSVRSDLSPLVPAEGPLRGKWGRQLAALLHARALNYARDKWLMFLLIVLPSLFVATAMAFSMIRPPPDNEVSLRLHPALYGESTDFLVPNPSAYADIDPRLAQRVMAALQYGQQARNWTSKDTPICKCTETKQVCDQNVAVDRPKLMVLPNVTTLNEWLVASQEAYIEKRYGGYTSSLKNNVTYLVAWYNNKGHHALPSYLSALHSALLQAVSGDVTAAITVHSHPLKISQEQLSKDTVYQHVADAGISALVLLAYCLVAAGGAVYLVRARTQQEKRLQLLCGVSPALYWAAALVADMAIIITNLVISVIVFEAFAFPVFVARNNLPAICILILLYGFASSSLVHVCEKLFSEASMANMLMFCGSAFAGTVGITLLLILDIISDSDETTNARWVLHKVFMLCPQFVLGDGLLEIAKNTIQAQVLVRFGMDTYRDPLGSDLVALHYVALVLVGVFLWALNLAIEYDCFAWILDRLRSETIEEQPSGEMEELEVAAERKRVHEAITRAAEGPVRLPTIGNINAGFVDTEVQKNSIRRVVSPPRDVLQCYALRKSFPSLGGRRVAVRDLSLGVPPGQCTALLGQNGAGKSTTFAMLTGELRPSGGTVFLGDRPAGQRQLCQGLISYCPQRDAIDPLLTVQETMQLYCRLRGLDDHHQVIKRALEMFGLSRYARVRGGALSGGNKRKLCTALAFTGRTPLVLLDEPTSGMDPVSRACVSAGTAVARAQSRGVVVSTHALPEARRVAARVALMRDGRLAAIAPLDDCLTRFGGGYVVACRCRGGPARLWRAVRALAPHAQLRALHHASLLFLLPSVATVNKKEVKTSLSDIFALMARLQSTNDIEDYTINQSSLDQMFLSFSDREEEEEPVDLEELPTELQLRRNSEELNSITSL